MPRNFALRSANLRSGPVRDSRNVLPSQQKASGAIIGVHSRELTAAVLRSFREQLTGAQQRSNLISFTEMAKVVDNLAAQYITQPQFASCVSGSTLPLERWLCRRLQESVDKTNQ